MSSQSSTEWDAETYHRVAAPQTEWGRRILVELELGGDEHVIDAGCGTGRLSAELLERLPRGRLVAIDRSENMLQVARQHLSPRFGGRVEFLQTDLGSLAIASWADLIFSTATFHWVRDHAALFAGLHRALRPGGRLVAQCGGGPNIVVLLGRAARLMRAPQYAPFFEGWVGPWEFADAETTAKRLCAAGFTDVETSLEPAPVTLADEPTFEEFLRCVIIRPHLEQLPEARRRHFVHHLAEQASYDEPPFLLDYWRLNMRARKPE
jgi:trans-aconitate 2-methyltransferase